MARGDGKEKCVAFVCACVCVCVCVLIVQFLAHNGLHTNTCERPYSASLVQLGEMQLVQWVMLP